MQVPTVALGGLRVTRLMMGGNPFSGFSHQSRARTAEMVAWYTDDRIVETLFQAESLGLNACICRGDERVAHILARYWKAGGKMRWVAQTVSTSETVVAGVQFCVEHGASACFVHGGIVDHCIAQQRYDELRAAAEAIHQAKIPAGIAGHMPQDFLWAEQNLNLDFYMVCHYNPSPRQKVPHHDPAAAEQYLAEDREARVATIARLSRPVIHYKILSAGRANPAEAFAYTARHMRPNDAVCVGIYTKDDPDMLAKDIALLLENLRTVGQ